MVLRFFGFDEIDGALETLHGNAFFGVDHGHGFLEKIPDRDVHAAQQTVNSGKYFFEIAHYFTAACICMNVAVKRRFSMPNGIKTFHAKFMS
jgi:hypothetical protein